MTTWNWIKKSMIIAVFAALMLAMGCAGKEEPQAPSSVAPGKLEEKSGDNNTATPALEERGTVRVGIYDRGTVPKAEGTLEDNRWVKWMNEVGPVNVEIVPIPRFESIQAFNTLFASGSAPDLIFEYDTNYRNQLYTQKQLLPIDELIEQHSTTYKELVQKVPLLDKLGRKPDGELYEVGQIMKTSPNYVMYIRQDWLENLKLEVPTTAEELYQAAKAFAERDPDGNGQKDTYGIALSFRSGEMIDHMFQNVNWVVEDNQLVHDWDRVKAATEFKKRLYDEGLVDRDYLVDTNGSKAEQDWVTGKLGIWGANNGTASLGYNAYKTLMQNDPDAKVLPIALPASEFGQFSSFIAPPARTLGMVNAMAKDPAAVIKLIDFMVSKEYSTAMSFGFEGVHHKIGANGCPEIIPEKNEEISYLQDFRIIQSNNLYFGDCGELISKLDPDDPIDKQFIAFIHIAQDAYVNKERPIPFYTHHSAYPSVPDDIALIETNTAETMADYWVKAVVGGSNYTVDNALADAQKAWEKAGGVKVEEWYRNWYQENKDKAFLTPDIYK